ncbi:hypothetical protein R3P38DRAFT_3620931 [Favolaschia claudopus]|uniref:MAGE domain-containing protein n=1 Tax=Favolaschia claudopus TaxID=2862362 RepID=A0AAW0A241_9AGAR
MPASTEEILLRAQAARRADEAASSEPPSSPGPSSPLHSESDPLPTQSLLPRLQASATDMARLKAFGIRAVKKAKLDDNLEAEFIQYLETPDRDERNALQHLQLLKVEHMLSDFMGDRVTQYRVSAELKKTFRKYIWGLLTLSNLKVYGGDLEIVLIQAMHADGIKGIPSKDSEEYTVFLTALAREVSVQRSTFKSAVKDSLDDDSDYRNIALLGEHIVNHAPDQTLTLGFLMRLAVIRVCVTENFKESEFWGKTDDLFAKYAMNGPEAALKEIYKDDCDQYGHPKNTKVKIEADATTKYLKNLFGRAPGIQRTQKRGGVKRKRAVKKSTNDDNNGDGSGVEDGEGVQSGGGAGV